jgi:hypothetical protein
MYLEYFETTADDYMEECHWDEALKEKTRKPVAPNGKCNFDLKQAQKIVDLAWFEDPRRPVKISMWDETAKKKMREPVLGNGYHNLSDAIVRNLIEFASLY